MLVIEIDGDSHAGQKEYDILRSEKLNSYGIKVVRYTNDDILCNIEEVYQDLQSKIKECGDKLYEFKRPDNQKSPRTS